MITRPLRVSVPLYCFNNNLNDEHRNALLDIHSSIEYALPMATYLGGVLFSIYDFNYTEARANATEHFWDELHTDYTEGWDRSHDEVDMVIIAMLELTGDAYLAIMAYAKKLLAMGYRLEWVKLTVDYVDWLGEATVNENELDETEFFVVADIVTHHNHKLPEVIRDSV